MTKKILILGASGNFGSKIAKKLAHENAILLLAGRQQNLLKKLKDDLHHINIAVSAEILSFDVNHELETQLKKHRPFIVINTCGPFQNANYTIPTICSRLNIHYIDIADGRNFVSNITELDSLAKSHYSIIVSGASTVPGLSSAVIDHYKSQFSKIISIKYGISPGQKTERGLAVTQGVLGYTGKPLKKIKGQSRYGWQDVYRQDYPILGKRWFANCDIPDLDLFPDYYGIEDIQFGAGTENSFLHLSIWFLSWLVRVGLPLNLERHANSLLKLSHFFDRFGTENGGMHMIIKGLDREGKNKTINWFIIATNNKGPYIPTIPTIVLTKKWLKDELIAPGAYPCVGLVSLEEFLNELGSEYIQVFSQNN